MDNNETAENTAGKARPQDSYDPGVNPGNPDRVAFLTVFDGCCIGCIRVHRNRNRMAVIEDHALERIQRGHGLGIRLTGPATSRAKGAGLSGICLETRDLHLFACWACLKYGFCPGGIDRTLYAARLHTQKTALLFYLCLQG